MTIEQIKSSDKACLVSDDVAGILQINPQRLRDLARSDESKLGFPVMITGTRVKIPRLPFLKWLGEI